MLHSQPCCPLPTVCVFIILVTTPRLRTPLTRRHLETKTYAGGLYQQQFGVYPDIRYQLVEAPRGCCALAFGRYERVAPLEAEWLPDEGVWQAALKDFGSWRVHERTLVVEAGETNLYGCWAG